MSSSFALTDAPKFRKFLWKAGGEVYYRIPLCLLLFFLLNEFFGFVLPLELSYYQIPEALALFFAFCLVEAIRKGGRYWSWGILHGSRLFAEAGLAAFGALISGAVFLTFALALGAKTHFNGSVNVINLLNYLIFCLYFAFFEEMVFRGLIFQALLEKFNIFFSVVIINIAFAILHISNYSADALGLVNVFLGGVALSVMYILTKSLWLPTFFHGFWNFCIGGVFGSNVSGNVPDEYLLQLEFDKSGAIGRALLGGEFGLEGGLSAMVALIAASLHIFKKAKSSPYMTAMLFKRNYEENALR